MLTLTGCAVPYGGPGADAFGTDRELGEIGEYRYDDVYGFEERALNRAQLEAVTYRAMARIEVVRGLHFIEDVEVEVVTRAEYRDDRDERPAASAFENEMWRGAFVVDGETDANTAFDELYGEAVVGYYTDGRIVLVVPHADEIRIDRTTLVHELVHALQDQHFGLERDGETIDERRAEEGLIEGEAEYLPHLYDERCADEWECVPNLRGEPTDPDGRSFNLGLFLSIYVPYSEGPAFVEHLHESGGWEAVDRAYGQPPTSTAQLIHPDRYPGVESVEVVVEDRSGAEWEPYVDDGVQRTETIGQATLFATLWANGVIDRPLSDGASGPSPYNYSHPAIDGWAGDTFAVYERADGEEYAHVWELAWHSAADAGAFADAYRDLLAVHGATEVGSDTYQIDDDGFEGGYRIEVDGDRVTIVGAPSVESLDDVHTPAESNQSVAGASGVASPTAANPIASAGTALVG